MTVGSRAEATAARGRNRLICDRQRQREALNDSIWRIPVQPSNVPSGIPACPACFAAFPDRQRGSNKTIAHTLGGVLCRRFPYDRRCQAFVLAGQLRGHLARENVERASDANSVLPRSGTEDARRRNVVPLEGARRR